MKLDLQIEGDLNKILAGEARGAEAAVTAAVRKAGESLKSELRAQVAGAGLGRRLANAVRCNVYPERGESLSTAAWVFARPGKGGRGGAADIISAFEEGTLIRMQSGTKFGGFGRDLEVVPTNRPGVLLLVLPVVRATNGRTLRPATGRRVKAGRNVDWVPMFILVRQIQMPRLLDWRGPAEAYANRLPDQVVREWEARDRASRDAQ